MRTNTSRNLIFIIFSMLVGTSALGQLHLSYKKNSYVNSCISIELKNICSDTVYILSQSSSIYIWDSCFAFDVIKRDKQSGGNEINITSVEFDLDNYNHRYVSILPDSTFSFGARSNSNMIQDSLFASMYVYAMPVKKGESTINMNVEIEKLRKGKKKAFEQWRILYCWPK